jgi:hypothetical protein
MKSLILLAASSTLALCACQPGPIKARAALDCPVTQGDLTRTAAAADGKSCAYRASDGNEISLQLISGDATATLKAVESTLLPPPSPEELAAEAAKPKPEPEPTSETAPPDDAAKGAEWQAQHDTDSVEIRTTIRKEIDRSVRDNVEVAVGGKSGVVVSQDGDTARVNLPGIHITAKDDTANVRIGGLTVDASHDEAVVRIQREVRLKGEALAREKRGLRATYIRTGKALPGGYRYVGYEAAGPKSGPLAVATVRSKFETTGDDVDHIYPDVKRLVRRNGGV